MFHEMGYFALVKPPEILRATRRSLYLKTSKYIHMLIFTPKIDNAYKALLDGVLNDVMLDVDVTCPSTSWFSPS